MIFRSLSGRFLLLTVAFVMLAEVLIFVPSVARFRQDMLQSRLELAQLASLAILAAPNDMISPELETELLANAEVLNIVLRRDEARELILSSPMPGPVTQTFDLRDVGAYALMRDALLCAVGSDDRVIRVIGRPVKQAGLEIEITMFEAPVKHAMLAYGRNIFLLSLVISGITAALLFFAVRRLIVRPIDRVVENMVAYQAQPENAGLIIQPSSGVSELRRAEDTLHELQTQVLNSLRQKERLAALGEAVAKISHDLRNILTTAQLIADRLENSQDPTVSRVAPKLIASLSRAATLCEQTLAYGKAEEPAPQPKRCDLYALAEDVLENEGLRRAELVSYQNDIGQGLSVHFDPEQMFRVITNLVRNARQAIEGSGKAGSIRLSAEQGGAEVIIHVEDTGPGLPPQAMENLFLPFKGGMRRGGSGLGLAIAQELVRGHGGRLELKSTGPEGSAFAIHLPR